MLRNLKEVLAAKEAQFERAIAEANSKVDWDILQLRHLLDKADINYANNVEMLNERFEKEKGKVYQLPFSTDRQTFWCCGCGVVDGKLTI
ncbi:unnamed protein product [Pieris macdunnoughi]|uniref:Uncharacterized protein n=1 Tax=Pieris macdunnoughi TaxID=345717 RepID=A0A821UKF7_9NEOP|nr:unnamed protein product [Pieris macdunnoughi]